MIRLEPVKEVCMYLFIYENGKIETSERITAEDWVANAEGLVDFVDIRNPEKPLLYSHGVWSEIESAVSSVADR